MDWKAWCAAFHGVTKSQTRLNNWTELNGQTLLKAELVDHAPEGRKRVLAQSLSKSLLMFGTCQKSQCSSISFLLPVCIWMQPLFLLTWTQLFFCPEVTDWACWTSWVCHISRQVVQPIRCHWSMLPVVTFFLKEISGAALITPKLWPVIYLSKSSHFVSHISQKMCVLCPSPQMAMLIDIS